MTNKPYTEEQIEAVTQAFANFGFEISYYHFRNPPRYEHVSVGFSPYKNTSGFYLSTVATWVRDPEEARAYGEALVELSHMLDIVNQILQDGE